MLLASIYLLAPFALLALAGVLLWVNVRSRASLLVAVGFVATLIGGIGAVRVGTQINAALSTKEYDIVGHLRYYNQFGALFHYLSMGGIWLAAAALLWVAIQARRGRVS